MRFILYLLVIFLVLSCSDTEKVFETVTIETIYEDSVSIRAIEIMGNSLGYAANKGIFGSIDLKTGKIRENVQKYDTLLPHFRAIAQTSTDFFMLSIASPALLYKTGENGRMELVYKEDAKNTFYDAMTFWNDLEGIAVGDSMNGCLSIIITRDGGETWDKTPCSELPKAVKGEGAFAASNTNIKTIGEKTWIGTSSSRVYFSEDKGRTWQIQQTPIVTNEPTQGIFTIDFWNENIGILMGGDYTEPKNNKANKAITQDGGKTWKLIADEMVPDFTSCVQFVPNSKGNGLIALGFTGISYSSNRGETWRLLSDESFYTLRFLNDSIAYTAGKDRISRLIFK